MMNKFGSVIALLALSSCSTLDRSQPTMEADPAELGYEGLIYQNELMRAYEEIPEAARAKVPSCKKVIPSYQERDKWSYRRYSKAKYGGDSSADKTAEAFQCIRFADIGQGESAKAKIATHIQAGLALSDLYCKNYFARIALHSGKRGFWRNTSNDVGAAISAVLGLASVGAKTTSGAGVGFGLLDASFRNYDQQFLVGPDLTAVRKAVMDAQAAKKKEILAGMPTNYAEANMAIKDHADLCSFVGMRQLINYKVSDGLSNSREQLVEFLAEQRITSEDINKKATEIREKEQKAAEDKAKTAAGQQALAACKAEAKDDAAKIAACNAK